MSDNKNPWESNPWSNDSKSQNHKNEQPKKILDFGKGGGNIPPNIPQFLKSPKLILLGFIAVILVWLASGFYKINPGEEGIQVLFGKYYSTTRAGLNYFLPTPIGSVTKVNVEKTNQVKIGNKASAIMLTGDENIVDLEFVVQWRISNAREYLFNIKNPAQTISLVAESAMREVVGQTTLENVLTTERPIIEQRVTKIVQDIMSDYKSGIFIADVKLQKADPPIEVVAAFNDVQSARQDKERARNEALAYRNKVISEVKGNAAKIIEEANAYSTSIIEDAQGQAERFNSVAQSWLLDKTGTTSRIYIETMEKIYPNMNKIIISDKLKNTLPLLPFSNITPSTGK